MKHNDKPLVTVILTAYNHQHYIEESINSVLKQSYDSVQLIVIDNASTDGTLAAIQKIKLQTDFQLIRNLFNKGLCTAFNQALAGKRGVHY